jgi:TM2 domain-containing membrane protein YozV
MKRNILNEKLFWVILICLIIGFISFGLFKDYLTSFDNFIRLLTVLISCITLGLAYLLFDRYGIKKNVIEKQFDAVVEIIQALKKIRVSYEDIIINETGNETRGFGQIFISKDMSVYKDEFTNYKKDLELLVNPHDFINGTSELSKALSNIWTPPEVKEKFKFIEVSIFFDNKELNEKSRINISFSHDILSRIPNDKLCRMNDDGISFSQFILNMENCIIECEKWINTYADNEFKLNI